MEKEAPHESVKVRLAAVKALMLFARPQDFAKLPDVIKNDASKAVRGQAAEALLSAARAIRKIYDNPKNKTNQDKIITAYMRMYILDTLGPIAANSNAGGDPAVSGKCSEIIKLICDLRYTCRHFPDSRIIQFQPIEHCAR